MHSKLTKENDFLHLKEILIFSFGIVLVHAGHDVSDTYVQQIGLRNTRWIPRYVFHAQGSEWIFLDSFWSLGLILESGNVHPKSKHWCNQQNNWPKIFKINVFRRFLPYWDLVKRFRNSKKRIFLRYFSHKSDSKTRNEPQCVVFPDVISWKISICWCVLRDESSMLIQEACCRFYALFVINGLPVLALFY